jgi:hypothetical protein
MFTSSNITNTTSSAHRNRSVALWVAATASISLLAGACGDDADAAPAPAPARTTIESAPAPAAESTTPVLSDDTVAAIKAATEQFRDVDAAIAAGFEATEACVGLPDGSAAMGYHYFNIDNVTDGVNDATKPDILLYVHAADGSLQLAGVELFQPDADQDLATDDDRPMFEGHPFDGPMEGHEPGMPVHYDLHMWVYQDNPAGMLTGFNPSVHCDDMADMAGMDMTASTAP